MPGGAFNPQAFDTSAFSPQAFSSQEDAPGALRGSFSSTFASTPADLMLLVRQVAPENLTQGSSHCTSHCTNTRRRHPPVHEDTRKRARRRADEELLLAIL